MGACGSTPVDFDADVSLFHFKLRENIGEGAFGKVRIVKHKQTKQMYALKYISKKKCVAKKAVQNTLTERSILLDLDHPFIVNLRYAFQDDQNCFYVLDLMLGGDLRFHTRCLGRFPEVVVQFWAAELCSAIAYLHSKGVVHRDIKPDNVLLDAQGHAHLTDFNIACRFSPSKPLTGVAGSIAYMAPDVFGKRGYTCAVDWWALGVTLFELLFGGRPFRGIDASAIPAEQLRDHESDYVKSLGWDLAVQSIPKAAYADGQQWLSNDGVDAMKRMLEPVPERRLGCTGTRVEHEAREISKHPWFAGVDWEKLELFEIPAPWIPDPEHSFDPTHAIAENLIEPRQLKARKWDGEQIDATKLSPELRKLHEGFHVYDYRKHSHQVESTMTATSASSRPITPASPGAAPSIYVDAPHSPDTPFTRLGGQVSPIEKHPSVEHAQPIQVAH